MSALVLPALLVLIGIGTIVAGAALQSERASFLVGMDMVFWGMLLVVAGLVLLAVRLLLPAPAAAHDAASGWTYPLACCSDYDCREVADAEVMEGPEGYVIVATGEVVPMNSRKVRPSPDGVFHWCSVGGREDSATICLFAPHRGY